MRVAFLLALLAAAFLPRLSTASQLASHEMSDASEPTVRPILLLPPASYFPNLDFSTDAPLPTRFTITGRPVFLCDRSVDSEALDIPLDEHAARTGGSLWDCAVVLAKFLEWVAGGDRGEEFGALDVKGKRVVELGTGLGLLGISVSHLSPAHVTLTDLPAITARLPAALALNRLSPPVSTLDLDWTSFSPSHPLALLQSDPATRLDVLVASDVLWLPHLVPPLLRVLDVLLPSPSQIFILGYQERSSRVTDVFFTGLAERGFEWKAIDWERYLEGWHRPGVAIYEVRRKAD